MDREQILADAEKFRLEAFFLFIAYLILLLSGAASFITGEGLWFARSGSLVVLTSAIIEFRNYSLQQKLNEIAQESAAYWNAEPERWQVPKSRKAFDKIVLFTIILGTLIWGYGDLFFNYT